MLAAPHPPAKLVQLRDPVALGRLDEHHGGVRDVDADLDHAGRDQHFCLGRRERAHRLRLAPRGQLAVNELDAVVAELRRRESLRLGRRGARLQRLRLLDERADDEDLAPRGDLLSRALVRAPATGRAIDHVRLDRPAPNGKPAEHRAVQVAVAHQAVGARDRRRSEMKDVRRESGRRLLLERRPLADAEAVLLVHNHQGQVAELDRLLDQGVRAHHEPELARIEPRQDVAAPSGRRGSGEQRDRQVAAEQAVKRRQVLLGERLGWRHHRRLAIVLEGAEHRVKRDDRLARSDLAHQ